MLLAGYRIVYDHGPNIHSILYYCVTDLHFKALSHWAQTRHNMKYYYICKNTYIISLSTRTEILGIADKIKTNNLCLFLNFE